MWTSSQTLKNSTSTLSYRLAPAVMLIKGEHPPAVSWHVDNSKDRLQYRTGTEGVIENKVWDVLIVFMSCVFGPATRMPCRPAARSRCMLSAGSAVIWRNTQRRLFQSKKSTMNTSRYKQRAHRESLDPGYINVKESHSAVGPTFSTSLQLITFLKNSG